MLDDAEMAALDLDVDRPRGDSCLMVLGLLAGIGITTSIIIRRFWFRPRVVVGFGESLTATLASGASPAEALTELVVGSTIAKSG